MEKHRLLARSFFNSFSGPVGCFLQVFPGGKECLLFGHHLHQGLLDRRLAGLVFDLPERVSIGFWPENVLSFPDASCKNGPGPRSLQSKPTKVK